jgi:hypothetical protein
LVAQTAGAVNQAQIMTKIQKKLTVPYRIVVKSATAWRELMVKETLAILRKLLKESP